MCNLQNHTKDSDNRNALTVLYFLKTESASNKKMPSTTWSHCPEWEHQIPLKDQASNKPGATRYGATATLWVPWDILKIQLFSVREPGVLFVTSVTSYYWQTISSLCLLLRRLPHMRDKSTGYEYYTDVSQPTQQRLIYLSALICNSLPEVNRNIKHKQNYQ